MVKGINYIQYRKLISINFDFDKNINIISGTNGTCKTSILHTVSNSYQRVTKGVKSHWMKSNDPLDVINNINKLVNPKIESLTRGDTEYNDPAPGHVGTLYTCEYFERDGEKLEFRRHNSPASNRFSVKPPHSRKGESLPMKPVIYLGLFRLFSFGEFNSEDDIRSVAKKLPDAYLELLSDIYYNFTGQKIIFKGTKKMGTIKNRPDFDTDFKGVDSNTISAGEDNLFIILTALVSLKYYYENIDTLREIESLLLIDEMDASLHPEFQIKLLDIIAEYSRNYKIQVFFTTHSITLLDYALEKKKKVFYLLDNKSKVALVPNIDIYKINLFLKNRTKKQLKLYDVIPVLLEDAEARVFFELLLEKYRRDFGINLTGYFHVVDATFSSETIKSLTNDDLLIKSTLRTINILDGDQSGSIGKNPLTRHLMTLPGKESPEILAFEYCKNHLTGNDEFWNDEILLSEGYTHKKVTSEILKKYEDLLIEIETKKSSGETTKGIKREKTKEIFQNDKLFWQCVISAWLEDESNIEYVNKFYMNLNALFMKTADYHNINPHDWVHKA